MASRAASRSAAAIAPGSGGDDSFGQRRKHRHRCVRSLSQDRPQPLAVDDQRADALRSGDDGPGPRAVSKHRQLADVLARPVIADVMLAAAGPVVADVDGSVEQDVQLITRITLAHEDLIRPERAFRGRGCDPGQVLGIEQLSVLPAGDSRLLDARH